MSNAEEKPGQERQPRASNPAAQAALDGVLSGRSDAQKFYDRTHTDVAPPPSTKNCAGFALAGIVLLGLTSYGIHEFINRDPKPPITLNVDHHNVDSLGPLVLGTTATPDLPPISYRDMATTLLQPTQTFSIQ